MVKRSPFFGLGLTVLAYCALWLLVPRVPVAALPQAHGLQAVLLAVGMGLLVAAPTAAFMAAQIGIIYFFARFRLNWKQSLLVLAACLFAIKGLADLALWDASKYAHIPTLRGQIAFIGFYHGLLKLPITLLLILAASSVGYTVSLAVRDKNLLLPVVMFAACIDFWTVVFGPVNTMLNRAPEVVAAVSAPIPQAGNPSLSLAPMIGPGDFLFMALVFAAVHRFGMNARRNYKFVLALMTLGLLAVMFIPMLPYLPALIMLAVAVVAGNWREFKLSREEKISTAIVGVLLAVSLPVVWYALKPAPQPPAASHTPPAASSPQ